MKEWTLAAPRRFTRAHHELTRPPGLSERRNPPAAVGPV